MQTDEATLVKAARELMRWDQMRLAHAAGVSIASLRRFETGIRVSVDIVASILAALEASGVLFVRGGRVAGTEIVAAVALRPVASREPRTPAPHRQADFEYESAAGAARRP